MKELCLGFITCLISLMAYFDYLDQFRGHDRYMETGFNEEAGEMETNFNFESEAYDFYVLSARPQYLDEESRRIHFMEKFDSYKDWGFILYGISAMMIF